MRGKMDYSTEIKHDKHRLMGEAQITINRFEEYLNTIAANLNIEWEERDFPINKVTDTLEDLAYAGENRDRFMQHLDRVAKLFDIDWVDGDFPIDELERKVNSFRKDIQEILDNLWRW